MSTRRIRVQIDRLVLRGVPRSERDALVRALHAELARGLARPEAAHALQPRRAQALPAGQVAVRSGTTAAQLGGLLARTLLNGLCR